MTKEDESQINDSI